MRWLFWWRPPCLLRQVIVNLTNGEAVEGLLWQSRGPWLIIKHPRGLKAGAPPLPMEGEAVIHRSTVTFMQVTP